MKPSVLHMLQMFVDGKQGFIKITKEMAIEILDYNIKRFEENKSLKLKIRQLSNLK